MKSTGILFVNNFRHRGGGEEFLRDLLPGLAAKGVKVGLVCRPGTPLEEMFRDSQVSVYPVRRSRLGAITSVFKIAGIIRKGDYGVIDIQRGHDVIQSWIASLLSLRRPVLMYTPQVPEFLRSRFLLGRMDKIVTISRYIAEKLLGFAPRVSENIAIIHYGIDLAKFKPETRKSGFLRNRFNLGTDTPIIGTVGDLWKNQIEFLDALVEIIKSYPDARFALVASESGIGQVKAFRDRAAELKLDRAVLWAGRLSKEEMKQFYADIDIAVSTHRNEGFGIWILEALAMGKPVLAFNESGIRDSLDGCPAGVLVNGGAKDMTREILRILKDAGVLQKMSEAGPQWVHERFGRERMVGDYHRLFQSIVRGAQCPTRILLMISKNDKYGAQRIFLDQVAALHGMGHTVIVVGRGETGYVSDSVRKIGVPYFGIPMRGLRDIFFLRRVIKKYAIQVIHTTLDRADNFGVMASKITGVPIVSTMMVPRYHIGFRFADRVIVLSKMQRDLLLRKGIDFEKISVIRPGIDVERFANPDQKKREEWRQRLGTDRFSTIFCHISSLKPRKAHTVSIELVAECKQRGENPLLIIIGDPLSGVYYDSLLQKITDLRLEHNVVFTGWTSDIPEILSLSHFTVLPSENEALGVVLMEGMAAGTPIVARKEQGGAELTENYNSGFLYDPESSIGLLAENLIALRHDTTRYAALSRECRTVALRELSLAQFGLRLADVYCSAAD